jgi:hypothetical protein
MPKLKLVLLIPVGVAGPSPSDGSCAGCRRCHGCSAAPDVARAGQVAVGASCGCASQGQMTAQAKAVVTSPPAGDSIARRTMVRIEVPIMHSLRDAKPCTSRLADDGQAHQNQWSRPRTVVGSRALRGEAENEAPDQEGGGRARPQLTCWASPGRCMRRVPFDRPEG